MSHHEPHIHSQAQGWNPAIASAHFNQYEGLSLIQQQCNFGLTRVFPVAPAALLNMTPTTKDVAEPVVKKLNRKFVRNLAVQWFV